MLTPDEVKEKLRDRVPAIVAEGSGLHINTVYKLKKGESIDPSYETMVKISAYFEEPK